MAEDTPRYRQLADLIRQEILSGARPPGSLLQTEMEMCETHGVSRHTTREALRILSEEGLIERRRGSGTLVREVQSRRFVQSLGNFEQLLQYARDTRIAIISEDHVDDDTLAELGLDGDYRRFLGVRKVEDEPPQALTRIYILRAVSPDRKTMAEIRGPISEWIEERHGLSIRRVRQRMEAVSLGSYDAALLGVAPNTPALRTTRRYRDGEGRVVLLSQSLHPEGRFAYETVLERMQN